MSDSDEQSDCSTPEEEASEGRSLPEEREQDYTSRSHYIHGKMLSRKWDFTHHVVPPMSSSVTYRLDSPERGAMGFESFPSPEQGETPVYIYDRLDEPTRALLEENLAVAHGGEEAVCFASGMAAISAAFGVLAKAGDRIVAHEMLYGCTDHLLEHWLGRWDIEVVRTDLNNPDNLREALSDETVAVYLETPVNPDLDCLDIAELAEIVGERRDGAPIEEGPLLIVDNTFTTPFGQQPLDHEADLVVESLTKNVGGFGTVLGGVVVTPRELYDDLRVFRKDFGGVMSPRNAWSILSYGLPSLPIRLKEQQRTSQKVAEWLRERDEIGTVRYPGLEDFPDRELAERQMVSPDGDFMPGTLLYFTVEAGYEAASELLDFLADEAYAITLAVSLGQVRTLIEMPASMTHSSVDPETLEQSGIDPGGIRLSIGLEDAGDIVRDLERGLEHLRETGLL